MKRNKTDRRSPRQQPRNSTSQIVPRVTRQHVREVARKAALEASEPARSAVFHTTELLENIFECLPGRDLIVSTMVSRRFRDTVKNSTKLQKKLFFSADTQTDATAPRYNNIIFDTGRDYPEREHSDSVHHYHNFHQFLGWFTPPIPNEVRYRLIIPQRVLTGDAIEPASQLTWRDPEMSCLKMFLTQPPVRKVFLSVAFGSELLPERLRDETTYDINHIKAHVDDEFYAIGDGEYFRGRDPYLLNRDRLTVNLRVKAVEGVTLGIVKAFLHAWVKVLNKRHSTHRVFIIPTKSWIDIRHEHVQDARATDRASDILDKIDLDKD